jgi:hypothetical protein
LYGGQDYEKNFHHWTWDYKTLEKELTEVGFKLISKYNWEDTDHKDIDDYSQSYLPHLDKKDGMLMSLNVEAIK